MLQITAADWVEAILTPALAHMIGDIAVGVSIVLLVRVGCQMVLPIIGYGCYQALFFTQNWRHWKRALQEVECEVKPEATTATEKQKWTIPLPTAASPLPSTPNRLAVSVSTLGMSLFFIANFSAFLVQPINSLITTEEICQEGSVTVNETLKLYAGSDSITGEWGSVLTNARQFLGGSCANLTNVRADFRLRTMCTRKPEQSMPKGNTDFNVADPMWNFNVSDSVSLVDVDQVGVALTLSAFVNPDEIIKSQHRINSSTLLVAGRLGAKGGENDTTLVYAGAAQTVFSRPFSGGHTLYSQMLTDVLFLALHARTTLTTENVTLDESQSFLVTRQRSEEEGRVLVHTKPALINVTNEGTLSTIDSETIVFKTHFFHKIDAIRRQDPSDFEDGNTPCICKFKRNANVTNREVYMEPPYEGRTTGIQKLILDCSTGVFVLEHQPPLGVIRVRGTIAARKAYSYQLTAKYFSHTSNLATKSWIPGSFPTKLPYSLGDTDTSVKHLQAWIIFAICVTALWLLTKIFFSTARREAFLISASAMEGLCAGVGPRQVWRRYEPMVEIVEPHGKAEFRFAERGVASFSMREISQRLATWGGNGWVVSGWKRTE
ncbi:hypothetical protein HDU96_008823 [Phlyctochytrium bullatum]|nr:hypothetical protein HDU96_008823 [Phlyctochytrium bullatum]